MTLALVTGAPMPGSGGPGKRSAAVRTPCAEALVHVSFEAPRCGETDGLAAVDGDERVLT
ncbi:hypothetical protein ACFW6K_18990 [Streptomyces sp. NPDC058733]|uniref:hypothetical protein n=1 Tax=unclassified Streptomyces TaxID=2593676 RepID=UPI00365F5B2A